MKNSGEKSAPKNKFLGEKISNGEIPDNWKICKIRDCGTIIGGATPLTNISKYYDNGTISWITPKDLSNLQDKFITKGERNITLLGFKSCSVRMLPKNSILFSSRAPIGYVAIANKELCTNQGIKGIIPNEKIYYEFLYYLLIANKENIESFSNGTTFKEVSTNSFRKVKVPLPPLEEQKKIADFLDNKCSKIDRYVEILTNQIKVLVEYKKSLITETVTKGLNPDKSAPSMKEKKHWRDSKIDWIGEIPDNWKISRLKYILSILTDYTANGSFADLAKNVEYLDYKDYARLVRLTDLRENLENKGIYVNKNSYEYLRKSKLFGKEILIANVGAYAGLFCEMPIIKEPATLGPNMFLLKTNNKMFQHFLYYLGNAKFVIEQLHQKATSTAQPKLNKDDVKTIYIPLPPLEEQKAIADFLDSKCLKIDRLLELKKKQIENIKEYKKSLIYEYVTGKKEVK
ncbi:restriction endonuclease subunit S [bacterium]|nr:restriction endonuclease subunit S [bacterium]